MSEEYRKFTCETFKLNAFRNDGIGWLEFKIDLNIEMKYRIA